MNATPASRIGPYTIEREIGRGGMGVVYLALDPRLGRKVAIKALPAEVATDPELLARFQREARLLASLSHANIASVHGLEENNSHTYLVMEYVEGQTLAQRLSRAPMQVDEALGICAQIAAGVESAHDAGVIHRDLKPGNVMVTEEGRVKVLDFGLAREAARTKAAHDAATSPHAPVTRDGIVAGTPGYMSPEQARGRPVDKRTDLFSLGTILFECLTGSGAFKRATAADSLAAALDQDPEWNSLPERTPWRIRELLRQCLEKDPARRLRDAGDARLSLETAIAGREWTTVMAAAPHARATWQRTARTALPWLVALAAVAAATWMGVRFRPHNPASRTPVRFTIPIPPPADMGGDRAFMSRLAVSPDGASIVVSAQQGDQLGLYVRRVGGLHLEPIPGTEGAVWPLFSPDGGRIAFFAGGELRVVPAEGGTPVTLCRVGSARGACWGDDGVIYFASGGEHRGIMGVDLSGAPPRRITNPVLSETTLLHRYPCALPGGGLLYIASAGGAYNDCRIMAIGPGSAQERVVLERAFAPQYLPTGHLVFGRDEGLQIVEFGLETLSVRGEPRAILPDALVDYGALGVAHLAWSRSGTLAYLPGRFTLPVATLKWVSADGTTEPFGEWDEPRGKGLSRDGRLLGLTASSPIRSVWIMDLERGVRMRMTTEKRAWFRDFSPDGEAYYYEQIAPDGFSIHKAWVDRRSEPMLLTTVGGNVLDGACSPDGRTMLLAYLNSAGNGEIVLVATDAPGEAIPFLATNANERYASFSPDGRWVMYQSDETDRQEVYIRSAGAKAGRVRVSTGGGKSPAWSPDGTTVYYWGLEGAFTATAVTISAEAVSAGQSRVLFTADETNDLDASEHFVVSPDGQRFLMQGRMRFPEPPKEAIVVLNWFDELRAAAAGR